MRKGACMDFFEKWFKGFDDGLQNMTDEECGRLFKPCAALCAKDALKYLYQDLFDECKGDPDVFFARLHEVEGVDGQVIEPGKEYDIIFKSCNCDLHARGHVNTPKLCECSRQSILCELKTLMPERAFAVKRLSSILNGDQCCAFRLSAL